MPNINFEDLFYLKGKVNPGNLLSRYSFLETSVYSVGYKKHVHRFFRQSDNYFGSFGGKLIQAVMTSAHPSRGGEVEMVVVLLTS